MAITCVNACKGCLRGGNRTETYDPLSGRWSPRDYTCNCNGIQCLGCQLRMACDADGDFHTADINFGEMWD